MKYNIYIFISSFLFLSCKEKPNCCFVYDTIIYIQFKDSIGRDLLDQTKVFAYKFDSMKHYFLSNSIKKEVFYGTADFPKQMYLTKTTDSTNRLTFFPETMNRRDGINTYYDYLTLNSTDEDTIKCEMLTNSSSITIKKIWYNDSLVYTKGIQPSMYFIITK